jgi:hypothetical protein
MVLAVVGAVTTDASSVDGRSAGDADGSGAGRAEDALADAAIAMSIVSRLTDVYPLHATLHTTAATSVDAIAKARAALIAAPETPCVP